MIDQEEMATTQELTLPDDAGYTTVYTNGVILQSYPVPEGPEWRVATQEDIDLINGQMQRQRDALRESEWQAAELAEIADQLLAIEDEDPYALPGTERQWRDYRTKVRAWKEGAAHFPDAFYRPQRPS